MLLEQRPQPGEERPAARDDHLEQQRLALLERHAAIPAHRLVAPRLGQAEVVHRLAALVQHAHQSGERLVEVEARRDPHVAGDALGRRMIALVEPAAVERKADLAQDVDRERALLRNTDLAGDRQRRTAGLQLDRLADQVRQPAADHAEQLIDAFGQETGAEFVDQRIVGGQAERLRKHRGLVARERDDLLEVRREQREAVLLLGFEPAHLGQRGGLRQPGDQRQRRRDGVVALAAHFAQVGELPVLELRLVRLRALDQPRHLRRCEQRVAFRLEHRQLFATHVGAAARHHHGGVPTEHAGGAPEGVQPAELLFELLVRGQCHVRDRGAFWCPSRPCPAAC